MHKEAQQVPHGYEPKQETRKGTLVYYDTFEHVTDEQLAAAAAAAKRRFFVRLVLYPLHDETVRRMTKEPVGAYYKREDRLHEWRRDCRLLPITVDGREGKRKKYTPIDLALRYFADTYEPPLFLLVSPDTANLFASYASFEPWIVKIRLLLTKEPSFVHQRLEQYRHRWDVAADE